MISLSRGARPSAVARHDALVILQARMGSSRLPGKVLAPLGDRSLLAQCIERLVAARVGEVLVATTTRPEDEAVVAEAHAAGVAVVRGPVDDVLGRFVAALDGWTGPYVIRATADNPFVDFDGPARLLRVLDGGADYAFEEGLPVGAAVEAMRVEVLREAGELAVTPYEREHVTPFIIEIMVSGWVSIQAIWSSLTTMLDPSRRVTRIMRRRPSPPTDRPAR